MSDETPIDLGAIRARHEKATPGPWEPVIGDHDFLGAVVGPGLTSGVQRPVVLYEDNTFPPEQAACNIRFAAHSWSDIAALLALVESQAATIAGLRAAPFPDPDNPAATE